MTFPSISKVAPVYTQATNMAAVAEQIRQRSTTLAVDLALNTASISDVQEWLRAMSQLSTIFEELAAVKSIQAALRTLIEDGNFALTDEVNAVQAALAVAQEAAKTLTPYIAPPFDNTSKQLNVGATLAVRVPPQQSDLTTSFQAALEALAATIGVP